MRRAILLLTLAPLMLACRGSGTSPGTAPTARLDIATVQGTVSLDVEVAETESARELGLMYRASLAPDRGMVFLFPADDYPMGTTGGFWMKNTLIPLSIAFWDSQNRVVDILDMTPCKQDTCPLYVPQIAYVGAVEANQGFFSDNGVNVGDTVELER